MRGEHLRVIFVCVISGGSSPHARGTHNNGNEQVTWSGIIPACAGNTPSSRPSPPSARDHPRMRGEHRRWRDGCLIRPGSSPHARGTHRLALDSTDHHTIIPACAGNTRRRSSALRTVRDHPPHARGTHPDSFDLESFRGWDHPRMRGEHPGNRPRHAGIPGSSPHARGTHTQAAVMRAYWDYPRMRGEHLHRAGACTLFRGSSPHARGTHFGL